MALGRFRGPFQGFVTAPPDPQRTWSRSLWTELDHFVHLARIEDDFEKMIRGHISTPMNPVATLSEAQGEIRSRTQIMAGIHAMSDAEALLRTVGWTGGRSVAQAP